MKAYNKSNIPLAKKLRKDMTPWERHLWYDFLRDYPVRFQRQKAIGEYIVDFYCAKAGLVIELDGGGHYEPEQMQADQRRTEDLECMDLRVVRICNLDIDKNFAGVCEYIDMAVRESLPLMREVPRRGGGRERSLPQSAALTAPSSEGALHEPEKCVYALGFFDGVHLGHQALLRECRHMADQMGCKAGAVTFDRHPAALLGGAPKLVNTARERAALLEGAGMDTVCVLPFDERLMATSWQAFFDMLVGELGACGLVCGDDYRFGARGEGNAQLLKAACTRRGIPCVVVPEKRIDGVRVSSTHIRGLLEAGQMEAAVRFLGHPHIIRGRVVHGKQLGRTMGIPTANLVLPEEVVVPKFGVYACKATVDGRIFLAVTNVGVRPTVSGESITVEPWLLDFDGDLYGKELELAFYAFLRPERKFDSLEALRAAIHANAEQTRALLG